MRAPRRLLAILLLAVAGFAISIYQSWHFFQIRGGMGAFRTLCNLGGSMNCDVVAASRFAELLPGIPLSSFAAGWFLAMAIVALVARNPFRFREGARALAAMATFGALCSLFYLYVLVALIRTGCLFCLLVDAVNFALLALAWSLRPEPLSTARPDRGQWKTIVLTTAASVLVVVFVLQRLDVSRLPASSVADYADEVLGRPAVSVGAGPEHASIGPADAPVTIVKFSDFQCPFCRLGAITLKRLADRYPGRVRVVFRNFPMNSSCNRATQNSMHAAACDAARAAVCASEQGRFEAAYEELFERQEQLKPGRVADLLVAHAGFAPGSLDACMTGEAVTARIVADVDEGIRLGVGSTPTFFINGHKMEGALPLEVWTLIVDRLLAQPAKP